MEKAKGAMNPSFASLQECEAIVVEEGGYQEKLPTQTLGQSEDNNTNWGLSREERRILKEAKGSQTEEKGSSLFASDQDPTSGKVPRETLSSVNLGVGGEEGGSSAGEKMQSFSPLVDGIYGRDNDPEYKTQLRREIKPISRSPNIPEEISTRSGLKVEGDDVTRAGRSASPEVESLGKIEGTWLVSSGRVQWTRPKSQDKVDLGSGQACCVDRGSGSVCGLVPELGRVQGRHLGLGLDNRVAPSPSPTSRSPLDGSNSFGPSRLKAAGMGVGLSQGPLLRPFLPSNCKSPITRVLNVDKEGNATHNWEEGEFKEDLVQENDRVNMHRYGDNLYEQSPSPLFSVFGHPLLSGGVSGLGGTIGVEDLEPLRVVAADDREWDLDCSSTIIEEGEELGVAG